MTAEVNGGDGGTAGITLIANHGEQGFKIPPASNKRPRRFAVGQPGQRSTIWRMCAGQNHDDVCLASRFSASIFKISLHETGDWRIQWNSPERDGDRLISYDQDHNYRSRIMSQSNRPVNAISGWTDAFSIFVPGNDLPMIPGDSERTNDVQWLPTPGPDRMVEFRLFLVQPRGGPFHLTPALADDESVLSYVNGFRLPGGEAAVLFALNTFLDQDRARNLHRHRSHASHQWDRNFDRSAQTGPRIALIEVEPDGRRSIWHLSANRRPH